MKLRDLDPASAAELDLVAHRMRATLVEVEGYERGFHMYTLDWLRDRVRWHLDPAQVTARVVLAGERDAEPVGHTIIRLERAVDGDAAGAFGLISTTYVLPERRRHGVAAALLVEAERWFRTQGAYAAGTWTSSTNAALIGLYERHGYAITESGPNDLTGTTMVKLTKRLAAAD